MDDFGVLFFSEWDFTQWNLTWNMLANCIQLYLKFGVVQAPGERLQQRKLRQEIGGDHHILGGRILQQRGALSPYPTQGDL